MCLQAELLATNAVPTAAASPLTAHLNRSTSLPTTQDQQLHQQQKQQGILQAPQPPQQGAPAHTQASAGASSTPELEQAVEQQLFELQQAQLRLQQQQLQLQSQLLSQRHHEAMQRWGLAGPAPPTAAVGLGSGQLSAATAPAGLTPLQHLGGLHGCWDIG